MHHSLCSIGLFVLAAIATHPAHGSNASSAWTPPSADSGFTLTSQPDGTWQAVTARDECVLDSVASLPAKSGDAFAIDVRVKVGIDMNAVPELACFDGQGREVPPLIPAASTRQSTTQWQKFSRTFVAWPGTTTVRARLRVLGKGTLLTEAPTLRPAQLDTYETGVLVVRPHPRTRAGVLLESNFGILNRELISSADRDGDGKWALVLQDLDKLTQPEQKGEDWRSNFEDNPNVILWTDGAVLKSDSVAADRAPDFKRALHFRMQVHPGPYTARLSDPTRPIAYSLDGKTWQRGEGGDEIELGTLPMQDGVVEVWVDACYADKFKTGPAYFDYVRLLPTVNTADIDRLFNAAKRKPPQIARGTAEATKVPVTIEAPAFAAVKHWPARCGLPVPQGELLSADNIAVLDAAGRAVPSQNRITARWPDGSAKWLFVDFLYDCASAAGAETRPPNVARTAMEGAAPSAPLKYTIAYGNRVKSTVVAAGVRVEKTAAGLEVNTGAIQFLVSGSRFGFVENVRDAAGQSMQREPIAAEIEEADGRVWKALELPVAKIEVEQPGPLHTVLLVETKLAASGKPASGFYHRARIHAYAGSPLIEIDYFVANTDSRPVKNLGGSMASKVVIKRFGLTVRPTWELAGSRMGRRGAVVQATKEERVAGWSAIGALPGSANAEGRAPSLYLGVADFRETFPKALRWSEHEETIDLWAPEGGNLDWIEGIGKTHHLALVYAGGAPLSSALPAAGPILATASPGWYVRSRALGPIITAADNPMPDVEQGLATHMAGAVIANVGLGFENYGDHNSSGYVKGSPLWDNNEYDLPAACMIHFARTGDRAALKLGLASAQHYLDVDTIHYSSQHADWARAQRVHSHATFGHHSAQGPDYNHAGYVQGLIWHSYFLGEPTGIAGARGIADWTSRRGGGAPILTTGMERLVGHALMTCNDVYEATGDEKYLRAAAGLVDQALKWEHPIRSGFLARIFETPAFYSGCPFDNGVISAGLIKFNDWAKLPEIDATLVRFAQWILTDTWNAPLGLASKGGSPRKGGGNAQHVGNQGRLMARAFAITGDPFYLAPVERLVEAGFGAGAKPIFGTRSTGLVYNYLPWELATLHEQGDPRVEPQLEVSVPSGALSLAPGARMTVRVTLKNVGQQPVENFRASLHSRRDVTITPRSAPARIAPGETVTCEYELVAPAQVNLSCDYNRNAWTHWSAMYRRGGRAQIAHRALKVVLAGAGAEPARAEQ